MLKNETMKNQKKQQENPKYWNSQNCCKTNGKHVFRM